MNQRVATCHQLGVAGVHDDAQFLNPEPIYRIGWMETTTIQIQLFSSMTKKVSEATHHTYCTLNGACEQQ